MLIKFGILIVLVLGTFLFLGIKISESIKQKEIKMLFFCLYGMSIFTLFNFVISIYFFVTLKHKRGPIGPKGKKGPIGDTGEHRVCDLNSCFPKSIQNIIIDYLESKEVSLGAKERTMICDLSKKITPVTLTPDNIGGIKSKLSDVTSESTTDNFKVQLISIGRDVFGETEIENLDQTFCS